VPDVWAQAWEAWAAGQGRDERLLRFVRGENPHGAAGAEAAAVGLLRAAEGVVSRSEAVLYAAMLVFGLTGCVAWVVEGAALSVLRGVGAIAGLLALGLCGLELFGAREGRR